MSVYQNSTANLGVKLEITHASPDVANNRTTITYKAYVYKTGSHNPKNELSQTPMYLTINGQSLLSTTTGNYNLVGGTTSQLIKSGTLTIPHNADGTKSFTFSWNVNFTSTNFPYQDFGYRSVTTSGTYVLPSIARASTFTIPSTTITTGSAFTVTITSASASFTHKVSYIVGNSENVWTNSAATSYAATVPHSLFNSHKSTASVSGVIRVTTMNGSVEVGSNQRAVTINLDSTAIPTVGSLSSSNSNKSVFNSAGQYIRGISRLTATAGSVSGSYSSTIAAYEFRVVRADGSTVFGETSKTTSSHQFSAFDFPNSSSEVVTPQVRVRDSRGRYSAWRAASGIRVHYYAPPAIGTMTVRRVGSGNTTLQVTRNYSITLLYEGGAGSNLNTASLRFQHRTKGTTTATDNAGAKSTTTSLTNSNANLSGTFAANTSYEVRAILNDAVAGQVIGSWISVGTEFVPFDMGPKGVGVGKIHSNGSADLEVGSGGINSEGDYKSLNFSTLENSGAGTSRFVAKGIPMSDSSYIERVLLLIPVSTTGTVNNNHVHGEITLSKSGGNVWHTISVSAQSVYNATYANYTSFNKPHRMITCNYKGRKWLAIRLVYEANPWNNMWFYGRAYSDMAGSEDMLKAISIYNHSSGTKMNSEIYDSMVNYDTDRQFFKDGQEIFHRGNDGPGSLLDADLLDGKHASTIVAEAIAGATSSGSTANGSWYQVGDLQICAQNFSIAGLYSTYTLTGTWTYPKSFTGNPIISATPRTNLTDPAEIMNGTLSVLGNPSPTSTEFAWMRQTGANFTSSSRKYLSVFAIGKV